MTRAGRYLVAAIVVAAGCKPEPVATPMLTVSAKQHVLAPGGKTVVTVKAVESYDDGTSKPIAGAVTLEVEPNGGGSVDPDTVDLDAAGKGTAEFTMCSGCTAGSTTRLTATLAKVAVADQPLSKTTSFTLESPETAAANPCEGGSADCTNASCAGKKCLNSTGTCSGQTCETSTGNSSITVLVSLYDGRGRPLALPRAPVDSEPVMLVVKVLDAQTGTARAGQLVDVALQGAIGTLLPPDGATDGTAFPLATGADGTARPRLRPPHQPANGSLEIRVTPVTDKGPQPADTVLLSKPFDIVRAGVLAFAPAGADAYFRVMGVRSSGWREESLLRFALVDSTGLPWTGGGDIRFRVVGLQTNAALGGSDGASDGGTDGATDGATDEPVEYGGVTLAPRETQLGADGQATVMLYSGPTAGTFVVLAEARIGGVKSDWTSGTHVTTTGDTIAVVGARPSGRNFAVDCQNHAMPGLQGNDCSIMRVEYTDNCTAAMGDRFNNVIGRPVRVFWSTEAGLFGLPTATPMADPDGNAVDVSLGRTTNILRTLGGRMPADVPPLAGEPNRSAPVGWMCTPPGGPVRTLNPRDGLVTVVVSAPGEEGFYDENNNGRYDPGERFIDLGEPFVDNDDDDAWDRGEEYIDVNGNGVYDGPNGAWDQETTLWAAGHVVFTDDAIPSWKLPSATGWRTWPASEVPSVPLAESLYFAIAWRDLMLNEPAPFYTTYSMSLAIGYGGVKQASPVHYADTYGAMELALLTLGSPGSDAMRLKTVLRFYDPEAPNQYGLYTAPAAEPTGAQIEADCAQGMVTTIGYRNVTSPAPAPPPP